jgi:2-polyprenyl-6-hydroxyphenyl methylase/3-demethylubiquinone-9 3-methyltransferase
MTGVAPPKNRLLIDGHPDLAARAVQTFSESQVSGDYRAAETRRVLQYVGRVVELPHPSNLLVVGCGPKPRTCAELISLGHTVTAIEPVAGFAEEAQRYLGSTADVQQGSAERIAAASGSQHLVFCESILEHVESPRLSLSEIFRVLRPGGAAWITTTNRWDFTISGRNGEFITPFFNWFPALLKEALVYHHLHHDPRLANYSLRPAVHWFTYSSLCRHGRDAGFSRFYSLIDVLTPSDPTVAQSVFRRSVIRSLQRYPVLKALALTQVGHTIIMVKTA